MKRVVIATMHSDICPLSYIRGKCQVLHRERVYEDLELYKKTPNNFYFHQVRFTFLLTGSEIDAAARSSCMIVTSTGGST